MNREIEQYLKRVTRGLWGRKRQEVREELSAHIQGRITTHRIAGLNETDAVQKTLQELGQPKEVNSEMIRLHTLPTALNLGTLAAIACAITVTLVSGTLAQSLDVTKQFPSRACIENTTEGSGACERFQIGWVEGTLWTSVEAIKEALEPQGVGVESGIATLRLDFPGAKTVGFSFYQAPFIDEDGEPIQVAPGYMPVSDLIGSIANLSGETVTFEGWDNPSVRLGDVSFQLGTPDETVQGVNVYTPYLAGVMDELIPSSATISTYFIGSHLYSFDAEFLPQRFDVGGESGDIYGIVTINDPYASMWGDFPLEERQPYDTGFVLDVAQAASDGSVAFQLPVESRVPLNETQYISVSAFSQQPAIGETVIVRLTGEADAEGFGYEVVPPEQISVVN